jgi:RNase P/RNase MRP subunit p29
MKRLLLTLALASLAGGLHAAAPKTYQVTGPVVSLTDSVIVVQKGDEKWELSRANAKVDGKLAVGSKVTIQYRMIAETIESKDPAPAGKAKTKAPEPAPAPAPQPKGAEKTKK